jgi:hypothetical protein
VLTAILKIQKVNLPTHSGILVKAYSGYSTSTGGVLKIA